MPLGHLFAQVVIKTQTEYGLPSTGQLKKFPDLEAQKLAGTNSEERHGVTRPPLPVLPGASPLGSEVRAQVPRQPGPGAPRAGALAPAPAVGEAGRGLGHSEAGGWGCGGAGGRAAPGWPVAGSGLFPPLGDWLVFYTVSHFPSCILWQIFSPTLFIFFKVLFF